MSKSETDKFGTPTALYLQPVCLPIPPRARLFSGRRRIRTFDHNAAHKGWPSFVRFIPKFYQLSYSPVDQDDFIRNPVGSNVSTSHSHQEPNISVYPNCVPLRHVSSRLSPYAFLVFVGEKGVEPLGN